MLYYKKQFHLANPPDMMAPVAKLQLSGEKFLIGMPFQCAATSLNATAPAQPATIASLFTHLLDMNEKDFEQAGGFLIHMVPGDFCWIPPCYLVAEFGLGGSDEIATSLSWLSMTPYDFTAEALSFCQVQVKAAFIRCCEPLQKPLETHLQAECQQRSFLVCSLPGVIANL